jgi:hypothetical protein
MVEAGELLFTGETLANLHTLEEKLTTLPVAPARLAEAI